MDRVTRTKGESWWAEETLTEDDLSRALIMGRIRGPVDVLLSHDAPSCVPLSLPPPAAFWDVADLARSDGHRERVQSVVRALKPSLVLHGHYHIRQQWSGLHADGTDITVVSLDMNQTKGNFVVLDLESGLVS